MHATAFARLCLMSLDVLEREIADTEKKIQALYLERAKCPKGPAGIQARRNIDEKVCRAQAWAANAREALRISSKAA